MTNKLDGFTTVTNHAAEIHELKQWLEAELLYAYEHYFRLRHGWLHGNHKPEYLRGRMWVLESLLMNRFFGSSSSLSRISEEAQAKVDKLIAEHNAEWEKRNNE